MKFEFEKAILHENYKIMDKNKRENSSTQDETESIQEDPDYEPLYKPDLRGYEEYPAIYE